MCVGVPSATASRFSAVSIGEPPLSSTMSHLTEPMRDKASSLTKSFREPPLLLSLARAWMTAPVIAPVSSTI